MDGGAGVEGLLTSLLPSVACMGGCVVMVVWLHILGFARLYTNTG
jgi:hypothetical protein